MEKGNAKASSKTNTDSKAKQDVTNKHLRLPRVKDTGSPRPDSRRKSNPQKNQEHFDKRPRNRSNASYGRYRNEVADGAVGESITKQGCKKTSLNHLLNFTLAKKEEYWEGNSHQPNFNRPRLPKYNKELFLQANCQFIVRNNGDYRVHEKNPDILVEWSLIEEIRLPCHEVPLCPICLYVPVAAKITRCGHIYCWPCMLHYLALTDKTWQKCPICFEAVHKADLKSVSLQVRKCFTVGDEISMCLMKREKGTLLVTQVTHQKTSQSLCSIDNEDSMTCFQKLLLASQREVQYILNRERSELEEAYKNEKDTPESCFIESALKLLSEREVDLNQSQNNKLCNLNDGLTETNMNAPRRKYLTSTSSVDSNDGSLNLEINKNTLMFGNSPGSNSTTQNISESNNRSMCFFYQADDGQHIYLHNINVRMLLNEYGSLESAPQIITARLVEIERVSMTEDLRKRLRYLQHLPLTCEFQVVELDFCKEISKTTLLQFENEINKRSINRRRKAHDERMRELMIERKENMKLGKYPKANYNLNSIDQFPAYHPEDFVDHLPPKPENSFERQITNEDISNLNATLNCALQSNSEEVAPVESNYAPVTSFAQMLKDGSKTFTSTPKEIKPIKDLTCVPQFDVDSDGENYVPVYNQSFGDAIQAALDSVTLQNSSDNTTSSKKKKKGKKQLIFTTSMCRRNN